MIEGKIVYLTDQDLVKNPELPLDTNQFLMAREVMYQAHMVIYSGKHGFKVFKDRLGDVQQLQHANELISLENTKLRGALSASQKSAEAVVLGLELMSKSIENIDKLYHGQSNGD